MMVLIQELLGMRGLPISCRNGQPGNHGSHSHFSTHSVGISDLRMSSTPSPSRISSASSSPRASVVASAWSTSTSATTPTHPWSSRTSPFISSQARRSPSSDAPAPARGPLAASRSASACQPRARSIMAISPYVSSTTTISANRGFMLASQSRATMFRGSAREDTMRAGLE